MAEKERILYNSWVNFSDKQKGHDAYERSAEERFNQPIKLFLERELGNYPKGEILDVGSGLYPETYLPQGHSTFFVDWVPQIAGRENSYVCNIESLPFKKNKFEVVLSKQVYGYLVNPEKCLKEMTRVLKPGGLLILIDWEGDLKGRDFRVENFDPEKVADQIKLMGFRVIKSTRLIDKTRIEKDIYLTALISEKVGQSLSLSDKM